MIQVISAVELLFFLLRLIQNRPEIFFGADLFLGRNPQMISSLVVLVVPVVIVSVFVNYYTVQSVAAVYRAGGKTRVFLLAIANYLRAQAMASLE